MTQLEQANAMAQYWLLERAVERVSFAYSAYHVELVELTFSEDYQILFEGGWTIQNKDDENVSISDFRSITDPMNHNFHSIDRVHRQDYVNLIDLWDAPFSSCRLLARLI